MCAWLTVSTSGFYAWRDRPASATARRRARLAVLVQAIFDASDGTYGYRRIHAALLPQGKDCGPELVRDLMRELGLVPCQPRPWRPTTTRPGAGAEIVPDLVGRDFTADVPGTKLVGDITYSAQPAVMCSQDGGARSAGSLMLARVHIIRGLAGRRGGGRRGGIVPTIGGGRRVGVVPLLWQRGRLRGTGGWLPGSRDRARWRSRQRRCPTAGGA